VNNLILIGSLGRDGSQGVSLDVNVSTVQFLGKSEGRDDVVNMNDVDNLPF
jgi:hypothetical protein